ncbi:Asp-tRNA(Asn)/Glu-tRNA(Gln) amidotransferase subunit GatA [Treponema parvum]|uniref:Glutamyl-tRNA(Gln) amidotransferase subunit A n=1 Tax=Treponema parvum TaxID=138851 RepID=A0A975EYQ3_9SPIR|nr:Asp-tRNA(Asn)/Glu-tRNA(Gln) amidotransferase subunit GatA [Treponema parvum]QTQ11167.1 Asp-tRNA(Asn)/Glu-tRNA(Gln) amidotransferase subunit GatA [Treponema parvum]
MKYTINDIRSHLKEGKITSFELVKKSIETFEQDKKSALALNAFLEIYDDALTKAKKCDDEISSARSAGHDAVCKLFAEKPLLGLPFAVKDNISVKGKRLTCASKILEGYVAPYSATVISRLEASGAVPLGRCNQDEFAMGSSTEYSVYGPTRNPVNREYVSGGSSGGPAAAVASDQALFGLGTETGGSVRLPASYCGIYGLKTTYGVLSRWGVVAYGSSLDQVGILGHTPDDIAQPLCAMCGKDFYDDTSADLSGKEFLSALTPYNGGDLSKLKIAIPRQFLENKGLDADVEAVFKSTRKWFEEQGAKIADVDIPVLDASIASYYVIALAEAASNLSRFDGIRYGLRVDPGEGYDELYIRTRSEGFGPEVKRRIVIGNYVLSEQFSGDTYKKGMTVRARIQREMAKLFESYDIVLCPTCPTTAFKLGQKVDDPLEMYLSDLYTTFVNLARIPSLSVPAGKAASSGMPVGIQFAGPMFSELKLLKIAKSWDNSHTGCGFPCQGA